jgi:hypothetical protein
VSGHWILAASPPSTTTDALRAVSWNVRSGQPASSRTLLRESFTTAVMIRRPAELVNALPGNASTPLSVIRSHADATANRWG